MAKSPLSTRALALGTALSIFVAAYSAYAGLKIGGVYWPIVTTSLISLIVLTILGKSDRNEINIMQTAGSSGGLLAGGIIFTIPAAYMLGIRISYLEILIISLVGGILGIIFSYPLRKQLIEREQLPCADGAAAAALIETGDKSGKKAHSLLYALGLGATVSIARDWLRVIPGVINLESLQIAASKVYSLGASVSLIPLAGGYLIGLRFTAAWFLGAIFTYFMLMPYALWNFIYGTKAAVIAEIARPLGVGIVLGSAIIYFLVKGVPAASRMADDWNKAKAGRIAGITLIVCAGVLAMLLQFDIALTVLAIVGAFAIAYIAARSTGEMNVDPMEIFAMLVMIIAKIFLGSGALPLILVAAVVTIAAGIAGDMMQDLKTGYLLGTKIEHQIIAQIFGMVAAAAVIGGVLASLQATNGIGTIEFPAPQAMALKELVSYSGISEMLKFGMAVGAVLTAVVLRLRPEFGMATIAFGIGMYVPIELSFPLFIGGIIRYFFDRTKRTEKGRLISAGVIAGEGTAGVLISIAAFASMMLK
ncbi:MAG: OPT/YSL family transporter [Candidatus Micrarchaeota archaeon]